VSTPDTSARPPRGLWAGALWFSDRTPEARNRYVDLLRAMSILAVVVGHWLMASPFLEGESPRLEHLLHLAPWTQWLTWLLQVMPVFFFVGGFANGTSWESARRKGQGYGEWLDARLRRLIGPVLPLLVVWGVMAAVARALGVGPRFIRIGSEVALVPVWFLAAISRFSSPGVTPTGLSTKTLQPFFRAAMDCGT